MSDEIKILITIDFAFSTNLQDALQFYTLHIRMYICICTWILLVFAYKVSQSRSFRRRRRRTRTWSLINTLLF